MHYLVLKYAFFTIGLVLFLAVIDWVAVANDWKKLEYIAKPGVILALIAWLIANGGYQGQLKFFLIGLFFSLAGDIFLMLPSEKFIAGLISFLLAHIAYIRGFSIVSSIFSVAGLVLLILVGLIAFVIMRRISNGLKARRQEKLLIPILIYSIIICLMLVSALLTVVGPNSEWNRFPSILVSFGAILFFISDILLAWNKFVNPIIYGSLFVIIAYHLAQITITIGAGLNFLP
jgi:uncharacterized membrane protein YhhN